MNPVISVDENDAAEAYPVGRVVRVNVPAIYVSATYEMGCWMSTVVSDPYDGE